MISESSRLDRFSPAVREPVRELLADLEQATGESLQAFVVFGRAAGGALATQRHPLRSVMVLDAVELESLRVLAVHGAKHFRRHVAAPLVMTPDYIRASLDSFPLELLEIAREHVTLFGSEYFDGLAPLAADVRLECERELKTIQIRMHQGILSLGDRTQSLTELAWSSADGLRRVLVGITWLRGSRELLDDAALAATAEKLVGSSLPALVKVCEDSDPIDWREFCQLYRDVDALRKTIDAL